VSLSYLADLTVAVGGGAFPTETEILDALTEAGLSQLNATQQELPYLWFMRR